MGGFDDDALMTVPDDDEGHAPRNGLALQPGMSAIRTQTNYQTAIAVTKPRDLKDVEQRVLAEAARLGTDFLYSWRVSTQDKRLDEGDGKTTIEGMSIDGAMVLARNWGNCAVPVRMDNETDTHFYLCADFIDLETGFSFPRLFRQRKSVSMGRMDKDRAEDIAFQIGQSKAQRNAIDKAMPEWLKDRATQAAKSAALKKYADVEKWKPIVVAVFKTKHGVELPRLEERLKKPLAQWTSTEILKLDMIIRSIKEGETTASEEFPVTQDTPASAETQAVEDVLRQKGQQAAAADPAQPTPEPRTRKPRAAAAASATPAAPAAPVAPPAAQTTAPAPSPPPPATTPTTPPAATADAPPPLDQDWVKLTFDSEFDRANQWNERYPVGSKVLCTNRTTKESISTTTANKAKVFGDSAVVEVVSPKGDGTQPLYDLVDVVPFRRAT
jgi:hypothetical protein